MNKPFMFSTPGSVGFKLVVFAKTEKAARQYVRWNAIGCISYRSLKFIGQGHPSNPECWLAAVVRNEPGGNQ